MLKELIANLINRFSKYRRHLVLTLFVSIVLAALLALGGTPGAMPVWTGFVEYQLPNGDVERAKTLWDWMSLLVVPVALAIGAWVLNRADKANEQRSSMERQGEEALQRYLDRMSSLMLDEDLAKSERGSNVRSIARATTLATLRMLDSSRKGIAIGFLYEAKLIGPEAVIRLKAADLSEADLSTLNLSAVDLGHVDLSDANLRYANLNSANLRRSNLERACMRSASLINANLELAMCKGAKLTRATLVGANLDSADLQHAELSVALLTKTNMRSAQLQGAILQYSNLGFPRKSGYRDRIANSVNTKEIHPGIQG